MDGSVFLSSTRVVFATAFDRVLPEWVSRTTNNGVPYAALLLMLIPSIPVSYAYAFGENFATYVLDAVLVIAITFLGSTVSAALMPWLKPDIYNASPIARYRILGLPLITVVSAAFGGFLVFCIYQWFFNDLYGVNNGQSMIYMLILYAIALAMYVVFRLLRRAQGMDLNMVYDEIPEEYASRHESQLTAEGSLTRDQGLQPVPYRGEGYALLLQGVAVADGHFLVLDGVEVDRHAEGGARLVLAAVAAADGARIVVEDAVVAFEVVVELSGDGRDGLLLGEREDGGLGRGYARV